MSLTYTSRRGEKYYLHVGPKRGGGIQHYFSRAETGQLAEGVPEGFEVYETVNGQVYLRRKKPSLIREDEIACVQRELDRRGGGWRNKLEVREEKIIVHESNTGSHEWARQLNPWMSEHRFEEIEQRLASYMPVMRFVLKDGTKRVFAPERYCFRGSVDDWIEIGEADKIEKLAGKYLKHLGRDSFYELY